MFNRLNEENGGQWLVRWAVMVVHCSAPIRGSYFSVERYKRKWI